jgi:hypothetical protein
MKTFTSARHAQQFLSAFSGISPHFRPRRHRLGVEDYHREMADRFTPPSLLSLAGWEGCVGYRGRSRAVVSRWGSTRRRCWE